MAAWAVAGLLHAAVGVALAGVALARRPLIPATPGVVPVPAHGRWAGAHDPVTVRRLVRTNWVRTVGWSTRGVVAAAMVVSASG